MDIPVPADEGRVRTCGRRSDVKAIDQDVKAADQGVSSPCETPPMSSFDQLEAEASRGAESVDVIESFGDVIKCAEIISSEKSSSALEEHIIVSENVLSSSENNNEIKRVRSASESSDGADDCSKSEGHAVAAHSQHSSIRRLSSVIEALHENGIRGELVLDKLNGVEEICSSTKVHSSSLSSSSVSASISDNSSCGPSFQSLSVTSSKQRTVTAKSSASHSTISEITTRKSSSPSPKSQRKSKEAEDIHSRPSGNISKSLSFSTSGELDPSRPDSADYAHSVEHLDLASARMAEIDEGDSEVFTESSGSSMQLISSARAFKQQQTEEVSVRVSDSYKMLERSQSDASLLKKDLEMMAADDDDIHMKAAEASSNQNISECNRVYMDLSRAEIYEKVELPAETGGMMRTSSGRHLETIPQEEELQTGDLSYVYQTHRSFSVESSSSLSSSLEDLSIVGLPYPKSKCNGRSKADAEGQEGESKEEEAKEGEGAMGCKSNLKSSVSIYSNSLRQKVRQLQMGSVPEQVNALTELNVLMEQAWSMPIHGKDLAYELCDILRMESALEIVVGNLASTNKELKKSSARLLEQSLTTTNRRRVAEHGLELVVKMAHDALGDTAMAQTATGILESLFKTSEDTCSRVIKLGGLDVITYWCRCQDRITLKHCAIALSNLALYGGGENQVDMAKHRVPDWLFPLAFVEDDSSVRYYALLAIGVLVSNKEIENAVMASGTLALVFPFLESHDPVEFSQHETSHRHGRSPGWLKRLVPVLSSKREEAQALAAFHFVMEADIKSHQGRREVLYTIGAVEPLKHLASQPNRVASKLAAQALKIIGEEVPKKLSQQVPLWTCEDVVHWVSQVGFDKYTASFEDSQVDGDLLLRITEDELRGSLNMACAITRKRFLRELRDLKISCDYTSCDPSKLGAWLCEVDEEMSQYTYQMLFAGVDWSLLRALNDQHLASDCGVGNGIHRMKILTKIEEMKSEMNSCLSINLDLPDYSSLNPNPLKLPIDVFISYRRSNGSQLASLLKVHLQLRGFNVFIDVERLKSGKFDENLLDSVKLAKNFIIVLTPNALDRCFGDEEKNDWVHREISAAMDAGTNIIPLLDNFTWPNAEALPTDMRNVLHFNAVRWIHDYQDACVDKLERFLRGENNSNNLQVCPPGPAPSAPSVAPTVNKVTVTGSPPKVASSPAAKGTGSPAMLSGSPVMVTSSPGNPNSPTQRVTLSRDKSMDVPKENS